jgi:sugar (pentulose or hexulose) kinase
MMKNSMGGTMAFIGIDLGTTNIKAVLYILQDGVLLKTAICSRPMTYDRNGNHVEFDADAVVAIVFDLLKELEAKGRVLNRSFTVEQIALTGQAESLILLGQR